MPLDFWVRANEYPTRGMMAIFNRSSLDDPTGWSTVTAIDQWYLKKPRKKDSEITLL